MHHPIISMLFCYVEVAKSLCLHKFLWILQNYIKYTLYIIIYFVTLYCKTERGEIDSLGGKILQPLGVTKIPLRGSKKVSRARLKKQTKKTGEGNDIAGMEKLYPVQRASKADALSLTFLHFFRNHLAVSKKLCIFQRKPLINKGVFMCTVTLEYNQKT